MRRLVISAISSAMLSSGVQVMTGWVITSANAQPQQFGAGNRQREGDDVALGNDAVDFLAVGADDKRADAAYAQQGHGPVDVAAE